MKEYLQTLCEEKGIDLEDIFEVNNNIMQYGVVIEHIAIAPKEEQKKIKDTIVKIDFNNGDVSHFLRFLGQAIAI